MAGDGGEEAGDVGVGGEAVGPAVGAGGVEVGSGGAGVGLDGNPALGITAFTRLDPGVGDGVAGAQALSVATNTAAPISLRARFDLRTGAA